ncbi:gluconate 2-dehydrogenase subunit 3 family protein [Actinotalea sp. K2]|uniref:gluconate 2-dehydrogenase subunit 3 family protein n=1 Tax=Actinotalea sp. K2 TaxID=2939438 RepID=UPI0020173D9A|nr:gluconate 2-dehydrogenase subunit 3 family protein [Actinotalea sp. K2]MCL3859818.1 gluconate 2-dehydrogenase subunit 3 family protein [Actinotalea sp. K2]
MTVDHSKAADGLTALTFLNDAEARTVEAIAERIIPDGGDGAGAASAGVVYYIDRSIGGVSTHLQHVYRTGLRALDRYCLNERSAAYIGLTADDQDGVIRHFLGPEQTEVGTTPQLFGDEEGERDDADLPILRRLFAVVREHTIEGFFCDPVYGGNRDAIGWKLVGFPGAYWGYTAQQMGPGFDGRSLPIKTLSDLRAQLQSLPDNSTFTSNQES